MEGTSGIKIQKADGEDDDDLLVGHCFELDRCRSGRAPAHLWCDDDPIGRIDGAVFPSLDSASGGYLYQSVASHGITASRANSRGMVSNCGAMDGIAKTTSG
jgi:hypothetical protein